MLGYIAQRLALTVPVVIGILLVTFAIKSLIPTDAVTAMYQGQYTDKEAAQAIANMRAKFHLDQPWYVQFGYYAAGVVQGDFGESIRTRRPVLDEIGFRYLNTLELTFAALIVAILIGVFLQASSRRTKRTPGSTSPRRPVSLFGISMPAFFFGLVVILVFSVWLRWLPVIPRGWSALLLPACTLGLIEAAPLARITRSSMLEVLGRDYIRAARAKGVPRTRAVAAPRVAEYAARRRDHRRAANRPPAQRRLHHRGHLRLARHRRACGARDRVAGLRDHAGNNPDRRRQPSC